MDQQPQNLHNIVNKEMIKMCCSDMKTKTNLADERAPT